MALRDDLLPVIDNARQLIQDLGLRTSRVIIRMGRWSTGETKLGALTNTDTEILPRPKVRDQLDGKVLVTGITPDYTTGGWAPADLQPAIEAGAEYYFIVIGPDGNQTPFLLALADIRRNFGYSLLLAPLEPTQPDFDQYT